MVLLVMEIPFAPPVAINRWTNAKLAAKGGLAAASVGVSSMARAGLSRSFVADEVVDHCDGKYSRGSSS